MSGDVDAMVAWLRSVWDADEQAARQAAWHDPEWAYDRDEFRIITSAGRIVASHRGTKEQLRKPPPPDFPMLLDSDAAHIARHDPADTLARIQAERAILELHANGGKSQGYLHVDEDDDEPVAYGELEHACTECGYLGEFGVAWPCPTLRALASGYRHRAGWQDGWAP